MRTAWFPASTWWTTSRSLLSCTGRRSALLVMLNLAAAAIYFVHLGHGGGLGGYRLDLDVYRTGAKVLLHGGDLYGRLPRIGGGQELPFTYPPFAALAFIPLALAGFGTASWLLTAVTIASVAVTLWCFAASTAAETGARMRRLLPWALPAALLLEPVRSTLTYGQINALLMALVSVDCLTRSPRWPRGIGVGIAAALKLTPGVFLLFFLLRRDLRGAARAGLSFALCTSAGFAIAPHDSLHYWTQIAYQPARVGGIAYASNQSILGTLARLGLTNPGRTWLWLALALLVTALAVTGMRRAFRTGQVTHALLLNAAAGLLISPISWSHHWVWAVPALLTYLGRYRFPPPAADGGGGPRRAHLRGRTALAAPCRGWPRTALGMVAAHHRRLLCPDRVGRPHPRRGRESAPPPAAPGTRLDGPAVGSAQPGTRTGTRRGSCRG